MNIKKKIKPVNDAVGMMWRLDKVLVITIMSISLIEAVIPFAGIYLSADVLDGLRAGLTAEGIFFHVIVVVVSVFALTILKSYLQKICDVHTEYCGCNFDMKMSSRTLDMDYELLDSPLVNNIRARIRNDHNWGAGFYSMIWQLPWLMSSILELVISMGILVPLFADRRVFRNGWGIILFMTFFVLIFLQTWYSMRGQKEYHALLDENSESYNYLDYFLFGHQDYQRGKDIRIYKGQKMIRKYIDKSYREKDLWTNRVTKCQSRIGFTGGMSSGILQLFAWVFVVFRAASGALTVGSVVKYASTIYRFSMALSNAFFAASEYAISAKRQQSALEYMNIEDVLYKGSLPVEKRFLCEEGDNDYEIEFRNVSFKYPSSDRYVLKNFSFKFRTGERLAVVGLNGSGKTTFIKLLCRLYDPTEGEILLNGINIKKYDYEEYKSLFSVVFQDFRLFSFSIAQNVAASADYDAQKVKECLEKSGFGERILEIPEGMETYLYKNFDEKGIEISGGEAQKIALARALYKDAPFIVLDEPTAALDPLAEYEIYSRFNEIIEDKTAIYISHRLSSCRFCDDIVVFEEGHLAQRGSHEELVKKTDGRYYELWCAQAKYYNEAS